MRFACLLALMLLLPDVATSSPAPRRRPANRALATGTEVSASYSFLHSGEANLQGADFSASFRYRRAWRLAADLSVHRGSFAGAEIKQLNLMGGLRRVLGSGGHWQSFGQGLLGLSRSSSNFAAASLSSSQTGVGGDLGLGADYRLSPQWALRGQGDYLILHSGAGWDADPRLSIGLVYRFRR